MDAKLELFLVVDGRGVLFFLGQECHSWMKKRRTGARSSAASLTSMMILPALSPLMVMSKKTRGFPMIGGPRGGACCGRTNGWMDGGAEGRRRGTAAEQVGVTLFYLGLLFI